jgi:hypothetical protein
MLVGTPGEWGITAGTGMPLTDGDNTGLGVFAELPSTGAVLTAGQVAKGFWADFAINKAQTADVGLTAGHLQLQVNTAYISGGSALWATWEQTGTVALTTGNANGQAIEATLDTEAGLTATYLCGIRISSAVHASATITNFSAIVVSAGFAGSAKKPFDYILDVRNDGTGTSGPAVGLMRLHAVANVIVASGGLTKTEAGYLIVYIGTDKRYIPLYSA